MFTKQLAVAGLALGACTAVNAQDYFDFGRIPGVPEQAAVQVDLNPMMIGLFGAAARAENPAVADLLAGIDGVRVRVYRAIDNVAEISGFIDGVSSRLESASWERVVSVEDEARVRVYIRGDSETVTGITAMIVSGTEAVFVNVAGAINGEQLAQAVASFNAGGMIDPAQMLASIGAFNPGR